ncbi:MAG: ABC transporter permease [Nanoarchaeota archaeon]|nr:ABC transporter permease [Nanoarchaeota archaeon]
MFVDYLLLAFKNVRKRGIRSWLTMLGIFIGIAAVVSLISLGQGLETAITGQFGALDVDSLTIQGADTGFAPPGSASVRKMNDVDFDLVESTSGVRLAIPRLLRIANINYNDRLGFAGVTNIPKERDQVEEVYKSLSLGAAQGRLLDESDSGVIVVGNDFVDSEVYGKPIRIGTKLEIEGRDFEIIGILEKSSSFTFNGVVLMPEEDMREIFDIPDDEIDFIVAKIEDTDGINNVAEEIRTKIRREYHLDESEDDFEVQTPSQTLGTVNTILAVINIVVTGIALIALLVGGIGIANTMFTSVLERTKEIGVMKAIGAENNDILIIFILEAAMLGLVGGIVGALMGLSLALLVSVGANAALGNNLFVISPNIALLFGAITFSLLIGVISGIIPAIQASKLNPVRALRK